MPERAPSVAVLGTGIMGAAIARNLVAAGVPTRAWNRSREKAERLAADAIEVADSPAGAAEGADVVITMLADGGAVLAVMEDEGVAGALGGAVWLQMSTIGIAATARAGALAGRHGVTFVDGPVLGTKQPAEEGRLIALAAGPADAVAACEPVFEAIAARVVRVGEEAGAATRMKLVLNDWLLVLATGLAETLALADSLGVDGGQFLDVIAGGPMDCDYAQLKGKLMLDRSYEASFPLRLAAKDAGLVLEAADGVELPLTQAIERRYREADDMGFGDADMAAVYEAASPSDDERPAAAA